MFPTKCDTEVPVTEPLPRDWPESARNVTTRLRNNAPAMREMGWTVDDGGQNKDAVVSGRFAHPNWL